MARGAAALALLLVAVSATLAAQEPVVAERLVPQPGERVAVLPFVNISGLPDDDWIGAGFAETVAVDLERVASLAAVDSGDARGLLPREVGRRLGTPWVVSGAYQRVGERVRITARLVHVETGTVSRTANVTGRLRELFTLQDRIAAAMAEDGPAAVADQAVTPPAPAPPAGIVLPGRDRPARAAAAPGAAGFAPGVAAGAIDGPPAPVLPEVLNRDADGRATLLAHRLPAGLDLDGSLREAVYDEIRSASDFVQQFPIEGAPATERTEVWVFYDDENVYVAMRCWDSAPEDQWIANEMQRDSFQLIQNDRIAVAFDTFYDRRNGMAFMVNPDRGLLRLRDQRTRATPTPTRLECGLGRAHRPLRGRLVGRDADSLQVAALPAGAVAALGHPVRAPGAAQERGFASDAGADRRGPRHLPPVGRRHAGRARGGVGETGGWRSSPTPSARRPRT